MKKKRDLRYFRILAWIGFVIYLVAMVYFLFFCEKMGRVPRERQINLEPLIEIKRCIAHIDRFSMILNLVGNVVCFIPLGFVLPVITYSKWGLIRVTVLCMAASVLVEVIQLITKLGSFDIDDIILNTCGGLLGYILFFICRSIYRMRKKKDRSNNRGQ